MFEGWTIDHIGSLVGIMMVCLSPIIMLFRRLDRMELRVQHLEKSLDEVSGFVQKLSSGVETLQKDFSATQTDIKWIIQKLKDHD